jgi:hypothetical protein
VYYYVCVLMFYQTAAALADRLHADSLHLRQLSNYYVCVLMFYQTAAAHAR